REHGLVGTIAAGDALPRDPLLACGPAPESDVHDLDAAAPGREPRFHDLRGGVVRTDLRPERDAVAEGGHAPETLGLLHRPRAVAQAVSVELLPRRPADRLRLHRVELAGHLLRPVPDVVGHGRVRVALRLEEPGRPFERGE